MDTQQLKLILTADASGVTGATSTAQRSVERFGAAVGQMDKAWQANAKSARATSASLAQVNMQMTDIVVSLASGQQPLTVLLQQGGQLKDMFGGVAGALSAVGNAVGAMITPTTLAASALAGLAAAAYAGAEADLAVSR